MFLNIKDEFYELWKTEREYMYFRSPINGNLMVVQKIGDRYLTLDGIPALTDEDIVASSIILRAEEPRLYEKITRGANISRADFLCAYMYLKFYKEIGFEHCNFSKTLIWEKSMVDTMLDYFWGPVGMSKYIRKGFLPTTEYLEKLFIEHIGGVRDGGRDEKYYKKRDLTADECEFIIFLINNNYIEVEPRLCISAIKYAIQNNIPVETDQALHLVIFEALEKKHILYDLDDLPEQFSDMENVLYFVVLSDVDYLIQLVQKAERKYSSLNVPCQQFKDALILKFNDWEKLYNVFPEIIDSNSHEHYMMRSSAFYFTEFNFVNLYNLAVDKWQIFDKKTFMDMFFRAAFSNAISSNDISSMKILMTFIEEEEDSDSEEDGDTEDNEDSSSSEEDVNWEKTVMNLIIERASYEAVKNILIIKNAASAIRKYRGTQDLDMEKLIVSKMDLSQEPENPSAYAWPITKQENTIYYSYPPMILNSKFKLESQLEMLNSLNCDIAITEMMLSQLFYKDGDIALIIKWVMQSRYKDALRFEYLDTKITKNFVQALIDNKFSFTNIIRDFYTLLLKISKITNYYIEDTMEAYTMLNEHYDLDSLYLLEMQGRIENGETDFDENYRVCQGLNLPKTAAILEPFVKEKYSQDYYVIKTFLPAALITQSFALDGWILPEDCFKSDDQDDTQNVSLIVLTRNTHLLRNLLDYKQYMTPIPTRNREFIYENIDPDIMDILFSKGYEYYIDIYSLKYKLNNLIEDSEHDILENLDTFVQFYKHEPQKMRNSVMENMSLFEEMDEPGSDLDKIRQYAMEMNEYLKYPTAMKFYRNN